MSNIILGVLIIILSINIFLTGNFAPDGYYDVDLGIYKIPVSFLFFSYGIYIIIFYKNIKFIEGEAKYSKCPKCKTSYNYSELKDGICPTCNIKTIETQEYYEKYPDELDDV